MAGFYGYSPENFVPDNSIWAKLGAIAADTIQKVPEAIELEKAYNEGKVNNEEIYNATMEAVKGLSDDEVTTYFGRSKDELAKLAKPGRREGAEYMVRNTKIFGDGLKMVYAKKNVDQVASDIAGQNASVEGMQSFQGSVEGQMDIGGVAGKFGSATPRGDMQPIATPGPSSSLTNRVSPEDIAKMARSRNVPLDQLQPEMTQAQNRRDASQLGQLDFTGTQGTNLQRIASQEEGVGENTLRAISTMPNQMQEASSIISAANEETNRYKAVTDRMKAGSESNKERRQSRNELLSLKRTYQNESKLAQTELSKIVDDLQKPPPSYTDEETMKEWERTRKSLVSRQKALTRDLRNAKREINEADKLLKQENNLPPTTYIDDEVWEVFDQLNDSGENDLPGMDDPQYRKRNEAYRLAEMANKVWGISISPDAISNEIKSGATPLQILQALFENAMGQ